MDIHQIISKTYDKIASGYNTTHFESIWIEEFEFFKSIIEGKKVIDLGCGAGSSAVDFTENGFDYTGIDASYGMLKVARGRVLEGKFQKMDFSKTSFRDGEFDGFWAAASFLHIPKKDIGNVLQEAKRITKNAGIGFISVKAKTNLEEGLINENRYGGISRD